MHPGPVLWDGWKSPRVVATRAQLDFGPINRALAVRLLGKFTNSLIFLVLEGTGLLVPLACRADYDARLDCCSHDYDIPYIAGYSVDGKIIFIDRHLPRTIRWLLKTVRVRPVLLTHEIVEKALLTNCGSTTFMPIRSRCGPNATQSKQQASRGGRTSPS